MPSNEQAYFFSKKLNIAGYAKEAVKRWYIFAASIIVCVAVAFIYASFFDTPLYNSTAKLYVLSNQSENNITSTDFTISTYITWDFAEIVTDEVILEEVAERLDDKYSPSQLKSSISIENPESTRIIAISVSSPVPEDSKRIADSVCDISQEKLSAIMGRDSIKILRYGDIAKSPSSPNVRNSVGLGFLVGLALAAAAVFIFYIADNTITTADDVETYLGTSVLATIPYNQSKQKR